MKRLLRLYPAAWRARYEAEVRALMDDAGLRARDVPALLRALRGASASRRLGLPTGAVRAWFTPTRLAGAVAVAGGLAWLGTYVALLLAAMLVGQNYDLRSVALLAAAGPLILIAIVGLAPRDETASSRRLVALAALSFTAVGTVQMSALLVRNGLSAEVRLVPPDAEPVLFVGTALVLLGTLATAMMLWGREVASRRALVLLAGAAIVDLVYLGVWVNIGFGDEVRSVAGAAAGLFVAVGWIVVGWSTIRRPRSLPRSRVRRSHSGQPSQFFQSQRITTLTASDIHLCVVAFSRPRSRSCRARDRPRRRGALPRSR